MLNNNNLKLKSLKSAIRNGWDRVDQELIDNCINHVHKRLNEIFQFEFISVNLLLKNYF